MQTSALKWQILALAAPCVLLSGPARADQLAVSEKSAVDLGRIPGFKYYATLFHSPRVKESLIKNQFAVEANGGTREFFELYERNRYWTFTVDFDRSGRGDSDCPRTIATGLPSVVTPDVVLHNLHLFYDYLLATTEQELLAPKLATVTEELLRQTLRQWQQVQGTPFADAVADNLAFLAVGQALLKTATLVSSTGSKSTNSYDASKRDSDEEISALKRRSLRKMSTLISRDLPPEVVAKAELEFQRVIRAEETARPSIFGYPQDFMEDYRQYRLRGHYVRTPSLQAYARAMTWFGRMLMAFSSEAGVNSALLLHSALTASPIAMADWQSISDAIAFLVGPPDDISFNDVTPLASEILGSDADAQVSNALAGPERLGRFKEALLLLRAPEIQGVVTPRTGDGPNAAQTLGLHLFPQRAVLDTIVFQNLVTPKVRDRKEIKVLELPEIMGSQTAATILAPLKLAEIPGYYDQQQYLKSTIPAMLEARKQQEVYSAWLHTLVPLLTPVGATSPKFMQSEPYSLLRLNLYLASYAELKHDTVLYAKHAIAEMGGGCLTRPEIIQLDTRGYLVPEVELYTRVSAALLRIEDGLGARQLLPQAAKKPLQRLTKLVNSLMEISMRELDGQTLSKQQYDLIEFIGGDLEHFWRDTTVVAGERRQEVLLEDNNAALIADVFTGRDGYLHVATGYVNPIYVLFPIDGELHFGRGGVMSYYEVVADRPLTDREWRERLKKRPPQPAWTAAFTAGSR